jgi:hypothetical protein
VASAFFFDQARAKHRADNRRPFSHEQSEVDLRFRAAVVPTQINRPRDASAFEIWGEVVAAHQIENNIHTGAVRPFLHCLHKIRRLTAYGHALIESEI